MILVLSDLWLPFPGGAERLMFNLSRDLMRRGEQVVVVTGYEQPQRFDGPKVLRWDIPLDVEYGWPIIDETIAHYAPSVIVTHHLYARTFERQLIETGIPVVQVVLNGQRIPGVAFAVYISRWVRERAVPPLAGLLGEQLYPGDLVIPPPAFDDVIAVEHGDALGFIKPIEHKGVELFYAIAAAMPERRFVVLRGEWQDLEVIRPAPNIEFMEPVDDIREFYRRCYAVLVPSLSEDAGTVAQEATLNKIPCLSSNVDGLVETNAGGVLLPPDDLDAWVEAIRALDFDEQYANAVCSQSRHNPVATQAARLDEFAAAIARLR